MNDRYLHLCMSISSRRLASCKQRPHPVSSCILPTHHSPWYAVSAQKLDIELHFLKLPWEKENENGRRGLWTEAESAQQPESMKEQRAEGENPEEMELSSRTVL